MKRTRSEVSFWHPRYAGIWLGFILLRLLALLPYRPLMSVGRGFGRLLFRLGKRRRRIVQINLQLCFPGRSAEQRAQLAHDYAASVGMGLMECLIAWWWPERRLRPWCEVVGAEHLSAALKQGRGVILFTPHMVSIELCGRLLLPHAPVMPVYRRHEHPLIEHLIKRLRETFVEATLPRDQPRQALRMLARNKAVWLSPDQDYSGKYHLFTSFFGMPAATNPTVSRFARLSGAPVLPCVTLRQPTGGYRLIIEPALADFPHQPEQDSQRLQDLIECWVRTAPEQYHWMHRRFKTQPGQTPSPYAVGNK
ncbi:MAG: lysophospholipid acyltransferase family protein [Pseudomonadota bacterium]